MGPATATMTLTAPDFPEDLVGKKILFVSESLGPVNGVSRTSQSLIDYLREKGAHVATCAPKYVGKHINEASEPKQERKPIMNAEWVGAVEKKSSALGKRALGGAWMYHHEKKEAKDRQRPAQPAMRTRVTRSEMFKDLSKIEEKRRKNPEFKLQGIPLPYNPDLTVAYPFRLGVVYDQTFTPDLIYLASPASVGFQFLLQLNQLENPPPVLLNFQTDLSSYAGILFRAPLDHYAKWLLQMVQGYLFRAPSVRTIFFPSAYVRRYMEDAGAPSEKMVQLGRGVDTELFHPSRADPAYRKEIAPKGEIVLTCICRLAPEKGFAFLAAAAERLAARGLNFKLQIVGGNKNPAVENEVRDLFSSPNLKGRAHFTGMLRGDDLSRAYATSDLFLHCSVTETFCLVVLESMASGVPVIARDEGGPSETVRHGESGYLIPPDNLEAFVEHTFQLVKNKDARARMAAKAREQAEATTWETINHQVAVRMAEALRSSGGAASKDDEEEKGKLMRHYGSWTATARVYFAVGVVWVFWLIAVTPLLLCGWVHGLVK